MLRALTPLRVVFVLVVVALLEVVPSDLASPNWVVSMGLFVLMMKLRLGLCSAWSFSALRGSVCLLLSRAKRAAAVAVPDIDVGDDFLLSPVVTADIRLVSVGIFEGALLRPIPTARAAGDDDEGVRLRV